MTDWELLQRFVADRSDAAFAELARRHLGFVHACARRQVGPDLADDVAQAVFVVLARKGASLREGVVLSSWLFRTTRFIATRFRRADLRRRRRDAQSALMNAQHLHPGSEETTWSNLEPHLDDALAALSESDRQSVLLRYFEKQGFADVASRLGIEESAAKKRVHRALERMRAFLARRGVSVGALALGGMLADHRTEAAPASLVEVLSKAVRVFPHSEPSSPTVLTMVSEALNGWRAMIFRRALAALGTGLIGTLALVQMGFDWPMPLRVGAEPVMRVGTSIVPGVARPGAVEAVLAATGGNNTNGDVVPNRGRTLHLGFVAAESDQPVPEVSVFAQVWGDERVESSKELRSSQEGTCEVPVPDGPPGRTFRLLRVWVSAPGRVPMVTDWHAYEFTAGSWSHELRLNAGQTVRGMVRDGTGTPIAGAEVFVESPGVDGSRRENVAFHPRFAAFRTGEDGTFRIDQMPGEWSRTLGSIGIVVKHEGFAPFLLSADDPSWWRTNHVVVLEPGVSVRGRVTTESGVPIAGAKVREGGYRIGPRAEVETDTDGRFELVHVRPGRTPLEVRAAGYERGERTVEAAADADDVDFSLSPAVTIASTRPSPREMRVVGTIVDGPSGERIARARVFLKAEGGVDREFLGEAIEGRFDWVLDTRFHHGDVAFEVRTDGHRPEVSGSFSPEAKDVRVDFRLARGGPIRGRIRLPEGGPAVGAEVGLAGKGFGSFMNAPAKLLNPGGPVSQCRTDAEGRFSLVPISGAEWIRIVHDDGWAVVPIPDDGDEGHPITLGRWSAVEGVVRAAGRPVPGAAVNVGFGGWSLRRPSGTLGFDLTVKADGEGRFRFDHVPAGTHRVQRVFNPHEGREGYIGFSHAETVTVVPGETARVEVGGRGRRVTGRIVLEPPIPDYDWSLDLQFLVAVRPDLAEPHREDFADANAFLEASSAREEVLAKHYLAIAPDGSFVADDVPSGEYELRCRVLAPPRDPLAPDAWIEHRPEIGKLTRRVVVDSADEDGTLGPVELGTVAIDVRRPIGQDAK